MFYDLYDIFVGETNCVFIFSGSSTLSEVKFCLFVCLSVCLFVCLSVCLLCVFVERIAEETPLNPNWVLFTLAKEMVLCQ